MTDGADISDDTAYEWDSLVKGAAVGAAAVLLIFLLVVSILYFSTDYEFAPVGSAQAANPAPALDGMAIAESTGCVTCHSTDGSTVVGPTWQGLAGSTRAFRDGSTAVADIAYIVQSIVDPNAQVVEGFNPDLMPSAYVDLLTPEEVNAVAVYITSL